MLDAHQHFWTLARGDYGWLTPEDAALYRDFGPEDLWPQMQAAGITQTILVQAAETEAETEHLLDIAARTGFVAGVVGWLDMLAPDFAARLDAFRARPKWVGLRPVLQDHEPALITDPRFRDALAHVARRGVRFDILTRPTHLPAMIEALRAVPDLHAILDHISKPDMTAPMDAGWRAGIEALAAMPGLHCKISGLVTEAGPDWSAARIRPFLRHVAGAFGPDRLVFGSDWPVCTLAASYAEVLDLARGLLSEMFGSEEMAGIMQGNGLRFYGLPRP